MTQTASKGVSIVIPCLNEQETISSAVSEAFLALNMCQVIGEVLVADNGSHDGSQSIAEKAGARVVDAPKRGYGAALAIGIKSARYPYVLIADADMSYPFTELKKLLPLIGAGKAQFVLGSRLKGRIERKAMPFLNRRLGTPILSWIIRRLYALPTSDCNSGMRLFNRSIVESLGLKCSGMEFASEMLIRVGQSKIPYAEAPIDFRRDLRSRQPHLRRWRDGWRHLRFIVGNAALGKLLCPSLVFALSLLTVSLILSYAQDLGFDSIVRYHSAFVLISIAIPLLFFCLTGFLAHAALHESRLIESSVARYLGKMSDTSKPFFLALTFFSLAAIEIIILITRWHAANWGPFSEIPTLIRILIYFIIASGILSFDIGHSIIKLMMEKSTTTER